MNKKMIGSQKHGWLIDNEKEEFVYYDLLSVYEKIKGQKASIVIPYHTVDYVRLNYTLTEGVQMGTTTLILEFYLKDGQMKSIPIFTFNVERKDYTEFVQLLKDSSLTIDDPQKCLDQIIESDQTIGTIIYRCLKS